MLGSFEGRGETKCPRCKKINKFNTHVEAQEAQGKL